MSNYYTLTEDDVNRWLLRAFGRQWPVSWFMGRITDRDVGKRVYLRGGILQVENDEQLARRLGQ